jgi:hypothetical protein
VKGSRVFLIIALLAALGGVGLALALKHQRTQLDARKHAPVAPISTTK